MRIGDLKKIISIQKQSNVSDGMGGQTTSWVDLVSGTTAPTSIYAAIWPLSAKEQISSQKEIGTITHKVRIRYRPGVTGDMRVKYGTRYFNILGPAINAGSENRVLDLICKEVV